MKPKPLPPGITPEVFAHRLLHGLCKSGRAMANDNAPDEAYKEVFDFFRVAYLSHFPAPARLPERECVAADTYLRQLAEQHFIATHGEANDHQPQTNDQ